jgi:hydrogenase maturation protease
MVQASRPRTLILGLGNPLSGDDGFGAKVLDTLRHPETLDTHREVLDTHRCLDQASAPEASLVDVHTDLLNHIEDFATSDSVLLIDAILDPDNKIGKSGQVVVLRESEFLSWCETSPSAHQMSPLMAIKLFRQLYPEAHTRIFLVGLLVDKLTSSTHYATAVRIREAASTVLSLEP